MKRAAKGDVLATVLRSPAYRVETASGDTLNADCPSNAINVLRDFGRPRRDRDDHPHTGNIAYWKLVSPLRVRSTTKRRRSVHTAV